MKPTGASLLAVAVCLCHTTSVWAATYAEARAEAVRKCQTIDPAQYQSGLLFNPDGQRSYYLRSQCLQEAAVWFRDEGLCAQVTERRALLSSSWGYSPKRCRELVADGVTADRTALDLMKRRYAQGAVKLQDFRVERNGNGRDFDVVPSFVGDYGHRYVLTVEVLQPAAAAASTVIYASGHYVDANSRMRLYIPQSDIRARMPGFALNRPYDVRATVILDVGTGIQTGRWSDAFIERVFPVRERSESVIRTIVF